VRSAAADRGALRIRLGVSLVVISWLPIAQVLIWVTSADSAQAWRVRLAVWAIQIPLGFAGVAIAGRESIAVARRVGWRAMPRALWELMLRPRES